MATSITMAATMAAPTLHSSAAAKGTTEIGRPPARPSTATTYPPYAATATTSRIHARFSSSVMTQPFDVQNL
jgi:hypothetical protein